MTKQEILRELQDINIDASDYIYTKNYDALNSLVNSIYTMEFDKEEGFYDVLRAFRLLNMPFSVAG